MLIQTHTDTKWFASANFRQVLGSKSFPLRRNEPAYPPDPAAPLELPGVQARRHLFNCFCEFAARLAGKQPVLLVLEELHWADDSTLALLGHMVQRLADLPLLILGTYRDLEHCFDRVVIP